MVTVAHAVVTSTIYCFRSEVINAVVVIVKTIARSECQAIYNLETEINMTAQYIADAFLFALSNDTVCIVLDCTIWVLVEETVFIIHFHCRRRVESNPQRIVTTHYQTADTLTNTTRSIQVECYIEPLGHLSLDVCLSSKTFV